MKNSLFFLTAAVGLLASFSAGGKEPDDCEPATSTETPLIRTIEEQLATLIQHNFEGSKVEFLKRRVRRLSEISNERHAPLLMDHGRRTKYVAVITHGLYDSPYAHRTLAERLHKLGINVIAPLLPGHWAKNAKDINKVTYNDFKAEHQRNVALAKMLGEKVILIGHSTGGLLSVRHAERDPDIAAAVAIAPAFELSLKTTAAITVGSALGLSQNDLTGKPANGVTEPLLDPRAGMEVNKLILERNQEHSKMLHSSLQLTDRISPKLPVAVVVANDDDVTVNKASQSVLSNTLGPKLYLTVPEISHHEVGRITAEDLANETKDQARAKANAAYLNTVDEITSFLGKNLPDFTATP